MKKKFATALYKARTDSRLNKTEFAEKIGFSRESVRKWEEGSRMPTPENIGRIADKLNLQKKWEHFIRGEKS